MISANTNIKNLPQIDQIINDDFLVVENFKGTNKLQFKDFVIGPNNTSFFNGLATNIVSISSKNTTLESTLSSNTVSLSSEIVNSNNKIASIETSVRESSAAFIGDSFYKWLKFDLSSEVNLLNPGTVDPNASLVCAIVPGTQNKVFTVTFSIENKFSLRSSSLYVISRARPLYFGWNYSRVGVVLNPVENIQGYTYTFTVSCNESITSTDVLYIQILQFTSYYNYFENPFN